MFERKRPIRALSTMWQAVGAGDSAVRDASDHDGELVLRMDGVQFFNFSLGAGDRCSGPACGELKLCLKSDR